MSHTIPTTPTAVSEALAALCATAAFARVATPATLRVSGADAGRWLNGMTTAAIHPLEDGDGAYTFFLNAQGRILADAVVYRAGDAYLLRTTRAQLDGLRDHLDRFIIMDDVELTGSDEPAATSLAVAGPNAVSRLAELDIAAPTVALRYVTASFDGAAISLASGDDARAPAITIVGDSTAIDALATALAAAGMPEAITADLDALRVAQARPLYGVDMTSRDLPQETGQARALNFSKGCYLGQEIVERIRSRGQVHRGLTLFKLSAAPPALPAALAAADGVVGGQLTSAAFTVYEGQPQWLGLGIVRRDALLADPVLHIDGAATATAVTAP